METQTTFLNGSVTVRSHGRVNRYVVVKHGKHHPTVLPEHLANDLLVGGHPMLDLVGASITAGVLPQEIRRP